MFRIAIIDDEAIVREGLKTFVDWEELGFRVAFDADCARQALEQMELERIDAILTDIMMPDMDGLELIKQVKTIDPGVKTVILSGYEQFHYAREAIRHGAFDFLTKPVDFEELRKVFRGLRQLLEEERRQRSRERAFVAVMRERWLNGLIRGGGEDAPGGGESEATPEELELMLPPQPLRIVTIVQETLPASGRRQEARAAVKQLAERLLAPLGSAYGFFSDRQEIAVLLGGGASDERLSGALVRLAEGCTQQFGLRLHIGTSLPFESLKGAASAYQEAHKAKNYAALKGLQVVQYDPKLFPGHADVLTEERKMKLLSGFVQGDEQVLSLELNAVFEQALGLDSPGAFAEVCAGLLLLVQTTVQQYAGMPETGDSLQAGPLFEMRDRAEMTRYVEERIRRYFDRIRHSRESASGAIAESVKAYILEHYNEDIQLSDLSEKFYVHPVYLSKLFKDRTGENFIDYLSRVRIVKSKELLRNLNLKIYEVADMVGYGSAKYYSTLFKKLTGMTPKEYRDQHPVG